MNQNNPYHKTEELGGLFNVDVYRDKLTVAVPYSAVLVEEFRANLGAWHVKRKVWEFPLVVGPVLWDMNLGSWSDRAKEYAVHNSLMEEMSSAKHSDYVIERVLRAPKPHQVAGVEYLVKAKRSFLADAIGAGKTYQSIAAVEQQLDYPCLVVCEASTKLQWAAEVAKTVDRSVTVLSGKTPYSFTENGFVIINQDLVASWQHELENYGFRSIIVDESSNFASVSKRSTALRKIAKNISGARYCLTATAVMNGDQAELYNQLDILGLAKYFGNKSGLAKLNYSLLNKFLSAKCYLRRTTKQIYSDFPVDTAMCFDPIIVDVDMTEYRRAEKDILQYIGDMAALFAKQLGEDPRSAKVRAMVKAQGAQALVKLMKLRQICGESKIDSAVHIIEQFLESSPDEKLVVFGFHTNVVKGLAERVGCGYVAGGVSAEDRQRMFDAFQNDPKCRVIVLNTRSAGKGVTLSAASKVVFVESEWSQALMRQCLGRAHMRADNPHPAQGLVMMAPNTVDTYMADLRYSKASVSDTIVDGVFDESEFDEYTFDEGATQSDMLDVLFDMSTRGY